jgi:hypothetical protein
MPSSCKDIRESQLIPHIHEIQLNPSSSLGEALAQCLQESDCIMVQRHTPRECLSSPLAEELPTKCQQLSKGLSECK